MAGCFVQFAPRVGPSANYAVCHVSGIKFRNYSKPDLGKKRALRHPCPAAQSRNQSSIGRPVDITTKGLTATKGSHETQLWTHLLGTFARIDRPRKGVRSTRPTDSMDRDLAMD